MTPITKLKGVGTQVAKKLEKLGICTIEDLLFHFPIRYQDRTRILPIAGLQAGTEVLTGGVIEKVETLYRHRRMLVVHIRDESDILQLRFFYFSNAQKSNLRVGRRIYVYGEVRQNKNIFEMIHPEYRFAQGDSVNESYVPVYPTTEGLHQLSLRNLTENALVWLAAPDNALEELLPAELVADYIEPVSLKYAVRYIHRPPPEADIALLQTGGHAVQKRLIFEEMLAHSLSLKRMRRQVRRQKALALTGSGSLFKRLESNLSFTLTGAQQKVIVDIGQDLRQTSPMMRLVQGDVGSGKTLVAVAAMLAAVEADNQAALMAPTEILAEQHYRNLCEWLRPFDIQVGLLTGRQKVQATRLALRQIRTGEVHIVVGTHALFQESVVFSRLAVIVVDEQHRFGVHQRLALKQKGETGDYQPHQLIMTATPIPRSLAMTMYADLDYSVIDEMPPGRLPVTTAVLSEVRRQEVIERVKQACTGGQQAYWVCPLIEESEVLQYQTAEQTYQLLSEVLPDITVAMLHGRMKSEEKEKILEAFRSGAVQVLVATTVIEVGVDVSTANLMVVENAERFGLAQLHQLRGRIGRGSQQANCVLLYRPPLSKQARQRLNVMRVTHDGFKIAYEDMKIRGPGEVLGTRQTGEMRFRVADLIRDADELESVLGIADKILTQTPALADQLTQRWLGESVRYAEV